MQAAYRFLTPRAGLYADLGELERLRSDIDARLEYEVSKATGNLLDDTPPPAIDAASIKKRFALDGIANDRYPDGYYESSDQRVLVVAVRSKVLGTDLTLGTRGATSRPRSRRRGATSAPRRPRSAMASRATSRPASPSSPS